MKIRFGKEERSSRYRVLPFFVMIKILFDEYKKHKKFVLAYLALCIVLAFVVGAYSPYLNHNQVLAGNGSEGDVLLELNDRILGNSLRNMAGDYSEIVAISAEPYTALLFIGIVQDINLLLHKPLNIPDLPLGHPAILAVIALCLVASKFMKANSATKVFGICTLGYLEKFLGTVCVLLIALVSVIGLANTGATAVVSAATGNAAAQGTNFITAALASVFSAFMGFMSLIVNYIIKTVSKGLDALQTLFSGIPFLSFICETMKTGLAFFICLINVIWPVGGYILNVIVFIICCLIFKACYNAARYFEQIYFEPFLRKIFGKRSEYPLVPKHLPRSLKKAMEEKGFTPSFVIPVFVTSKNSRSAWKFKRFQKMWLIHTDGHSMLYFKKYGKEKNCFFDMNSYRNRPMCLFKGVRFYEIYTILNTPENLARKKPKKEYTLVFSKNYINRIDDIMAMTGYTDIAEQIAVTKAEKKALKKAKRQEAKEEFKDFWNSIFHKNKVTV